MSTNLLPRLSLWARGHRPLAIALLIALKMVLGAVGFYSGIAAALLGYTLPKPSTAWMLGAWAVFVLIMYPSRAQRHRLASFYWRQKSADFGLAVFGFAFWFFIGNGIPAQDSSTPPSPGASYALAPSVPLAFGMLQKAAEPRTLAPDASQSTARDGQKSHGKKWSAFQRWLSSKAQKRVERLLGRLLAKDASDNQAEKILLAILLTVGVLALFILVTAFACSLSCNGMEALAWVVFLGGTFVCVLLMVQGMRAIFRPKAKRPHAPGGPPAGNGLPRA